MTRENREYLQRLPLTSTQGSAFLVHASPACPRDWEYLLDRFDAEPQFHYFNEPVCFIGHTHQPAVYMADPSGCKSLPLSDVTLEPDRRYIINVGSVGQPRDNNPKAAYVAYDMDEGSIELRRLDYDIAKAQKKILQAGLPQRLAERLSFGK